MIGARLLGVLFAASVWTIGPSEHADSRERAVVDAGSRRVAARVAAGVATAVTLGLLVAARRLRASARAESIDRLLEEEIRATVDRDETRRSE